MQWRPRKTVSIKKSVKPYLTHWTFLPPFLVFRDTSLQKTTFTFQINLNLRYNALKITP